MKLPLLLILSVDLYGLALSAHGQAMFRGNPAHTGVYSGPAPRQFHRVKWKFPTGNRIIASPVIEGRTIFFGSDDGNVYAVDNETGRQIWKTKTRGPVSATPAIANGTLYVGSYDGNFYALNLETGALKWKFATGGERRFEAKGLNGWQPKNQTIADPFDIFLSSPVVVDGAVYFGSGDGNVYRLDANSGQLNWKFKTGDVVHASPAFADNTIFVGSWDSYFYAVDAKSGKEKWRFHGGEDALIHNQVGFQSSPAIVDGVVYTGCRDAQLYALDASTGKERWKFDNQLSWVITSPAVLSGKVYFATSDSSLYHVAEAATGKSLVKEDGRAYMFSSPAVANDTVFIGVLNGTFMARDATTGKVLWEFQTDASKENKGWVLTAERRFNEPLLFFDNWREGPLVAQDRQISVGSIFSSPLVASGTVYFGSTDGFLYAID
ncbi:MAG TPA: PQQ-binding-like beta-propeller repeat protein [Candidatus Udaeobacter sp.]|jgi:outer membrane protein assembly factor BamB|nr:PQQ-binding-like beta-propeller repeat protein [Candidatus Udaeobacter sp.]